MPEHLPMCFAPCSPEMVHNGSAASVNPKDSLELRKEPNVEREKKWTCFSLASDSDVEQLYDALSMRLNVDGKRRYLIVACVGSGHWGVLCKLDQERVVKLPDCISAAYDIKGSTRSGVASFCKSLFQEASALKANLKLRCEEANHGEQMEAHAKTQEMLAQIFGGCGDGATAAQLRLRKRAYDMVTQELINKKAAEERAAKKCSAGAVMAAGLAASAGGAAAGAALRCEAHLGQTCAASTASGKPHGKWAARGGQGPTSSTSCRA